MSNKKMIHYNLDNIDACGARFNLIYGERSNGKSYQEKKRISYVLNNHEIDIDTWPGIPTYMEIEGESEEDINGILNLLGYSMKDTISCTVDEVYKKMGIDMLSIRELKF